MAGRDGFFFNLGWLVLALSIETIGKPIWVNSYVLEKEREKRDMYLAFNLRRQITGLTY